jgi:hypothetical protein
MQGHMLLFSMACQQTAAACRAGEASPFILHFVVESFVSLSDWDIALWGKWYVPAAAARHCRNERSNSSLPPDLY